MSAIFGIVDFEGHLIKDEWVASMQADLAHRGPDGQGLYREESVVLGHMLLQVTPESVYDSSPYEEDGFVITANARLDEREAIMDKLGIEGSDRDKITDPLLLLRSFRKYGKDFVKDIYGDFAFAIWNKEKRELFCARDQIGVKPFLYCFRDGRFVFSTELKAIARLEFVKASPDNEYLRNQVLYLFNKPGETNWKNIYRLDAAHYLCLGKKTTRLEKYWALKYRRRSDQVMAESCALELKMILTKAVSDRMRTGGKIGVPLSGGLDSGSIACLAAREMDRTGKKIYTASTILDPKERSPDETDESEYIHSILAAETNIVPAFIPHTNLSFIDSVFSRFSRYYALFSSYNYVDEALFSEFHSKGIRRILHGYVGDQTASNSTVRPLVHLFFRGRFRTFMKLTWLIQKKSGLSMFIVLKKEFLLPLTPPCLLSAWERLRGRERIKNGTKALNLPLNLGLRDYRRLNKLMRKFHKTFYRYKLNPDKKVWPDENNYFREDWDCGSSYYGVEITYPLADRRVLEFLMTVPEECFKADGLDRGLIRMAMKDILPEPVRMRKGKGYYSPGYYHIIKKDLPQLSKLIEFEAEDLDARCGLFNISKIRNSLNDLINSKSVCSFTPHDWTIIEVSMWLLFNKWNNYRSLNTGRDA
jgi:asparagine synthase (glutamine-hydrolysing)